MSQPQSESYTAAKGGIAALTHALAVSFAGRVRVNSISTGWIDTAYTVYEGPDALQQPTVPPLVPVGFKIPHGVLMTGGEGFNFPDSAGGKVDFGPVAGEAVGDAKVFPCKIQLALEGSADNQDHAFTSLKHMAQMSKPPTLAIKSTGSLGSGRLRSRAWRMTAFFFTKAPSVMPPPGPSPLHVHIQQGRKHR